MKLFRKRKEPEPIYIPHYVNIEPLVDEAHDLLELYPDNGLPLRRNARLRLENAVMKYIGNRDNDGRDIARAIKLFKTEAP